MIRVGIDVALLSKPLTGIGRYTIELARELIKKPGKFFLYSSSPFDMGEWNKHNIKIRTANLCSRASRLLWAQTCLPYWAAKDHVDLFWGPSHRLPRFLPSRIARVITIHDLTWKYAGDTMRPMSKFIEKTLMPQAIKQADIIVADSTSTSKSIEEEYTVARNNIRIVYPGVTDLPAPHGLKSSSFSLGEHQPYILFVGTCEPRKNLRRLMKAFAMLKNNNISLVIAGGKGWGNVNINKWIEQFGLSGKVFPVGYVTNEQLAALYKNCIFLAMPSLYEGFGLPIVEAMSFGKVVLTSNLSSMPEVAGKAAVLIDPLNEQSISHGLKSLLDKNRRNKLEAEAKKNSDRFTWQASAEKLWKVFHEATDIRKNI